MVLPNRFDLASSILETEKGRCIDCCSVDGSSGFVSSGNKAVVLPSCIKLMQDNAGARLLSKGVPVRNSDEYWRYTDPTLFYDLEKAQPNDTTSCCVDSLPQDVIDDASKKLINGVDHEVCVTFCNGRYCEQLSDISSENIEIVLMRGGKLFNQHGELFDGEKSWFCDYLGKLETKADALVPRQFSLLNSAVFCNGVFIRVKNKLDKPLVIRNFGNLGNTDFSYMRVLLVCDEGSSCTLIEDFSGDLACNISVEVFASKDSNVNHLRSQVFSKDSKLFSSIFAQVDDGSDFASFTLSASASLIRNEAYIEVASNANAHFVGASVSCDKGHSDYTVYVRHKDHGSSSRQILRMVMLDKAGGVFQGKFLVDQDAQKTDAYQKSQSLLLDDGAFFKAKPELEIYADDVKCSHGSTTSDVDPEKMFYLQSRGFGKKEARALMLESFVAECMQEISNSYMSEKYIDILHSWVKENIS